MQLRSQAGHAHETLLQVPDLLRNKGLEDLETDLLSGRKVDWSVYWSSCHLVRVSCRRRTQLITCRDMALELLQRSVQVGPSLAAISKPGALPSSIQASTFPQDRLPNDGCCGLDPASSKSGCWTCRKYDFKHCIGATATQIIPLQKRDVYRSNLIHSTL